MSAAHALLSLGLCIGSVAAFSGGTAPLPWRRARIAGCRPVVVERSVGIRTKWVAQEVGSGGGQDGRGVSRVQDLLEFVIGTTFNSRLYVGSPELHVALPLPQPDQYPAWMPSLVRLPKGVYGFVDKGVEEGWIKRAPVDSLFEIKYGMHSRFLGA
jgi:hypothetical protein